MKHWKLGIGALMATLGGLMMILGPAIGLTDLGRPWTFLAGFLVGVIAGTGAALSIVGLIGVREEAR